ncbi:hypothetical protein Pmgp_02722 [Pelotomaculum propionicicum]|uniref:Uncharacterized protein n=1 Tax=Pelotomaculum propionicicum TaxID=258475 RepID=A0A4Y7RMF4_9FIRM|nr:hypothetical protein Pmgp_02722 [Pelotomaculum propionicicum]
MALLGQGPERGPVHYQLRGEGFGHPVEAGAPLVPGFPFRILLCAVEHNVIGVIGLAGRPVLQRAGHPRLAAGQFAAVTLDGFAEGADPGLDPGDPLAGAGAAQAPLEKIQPLRFQGGIMAGHENMGHLFIPQRRLQQRHHPGNGADQVSVLLQGPLRRHQAVPPVARKGRFARLQRQWLYGRDFRRAAGRAVGVAQQPVGLRRPACPVQAQHLARQGAGGAGQKLRRRRRRHLVDGGPGGRKAARSRQGRRGEPPFGGDKGMS